MIDHVNFQMPERLARECATFYELLGFARMEPPAELGQRSIWLSGGTAALHLEFALADGSAVSVAPLGGPGHVAIVVPEYARVRAALRAAGVTVDQRTEYWNSPRCFVADPAGNRLELMEFAPPPG